MAYSEEAAERIRKAIKRRIGFEEKKMFGGIGFLLNGNMCIGVWKQFLILRIGPDRYEDILEQPFTRVFDITGKAMKGWVMVEPDGFQEDTDLKKGIDLAIKFVKTLEAK